MGIFGKLFGKTRKHREDGIPKEIGAVWIQNEDGGVQILSFEESTERNCRIPVNDDDEPYNEKNVLKQVAMDVVNRIKTGILDKVGIVACQPDGKFLKNEIYKLDPSNKVHWFGGSAKEQERFWNFFGKTRPKFRNRPQKKELIIAPEGLLVGRDSDMFPMDPSNPYRVGMYGIGEYSLDTVAQIVEIVPFPPSDGITLKLYDDMVVGKHYDVRKLSPHLEYIESLDINDLAKLMLDTNEVMCLRELATERLHKIVCKRKGFAPSIYFSGEPELWQDWWEENKKYATNSV